MKHELVWPILGLSCWALCAAGCRPKQTQDLPPPAQAATPCGPEAMIDDCEDNNNQVMVQDGRSGYWYTFVDDAGSTVEPQAGAKGGGAFTMSEGGANGSAYAARFRGTIGEGAIIYGGMGVNLTDPKEAYDASKYGGLSFYAKKGPGTGKIRLKVPDLNTDPQGGVCKECYNDFGVELELTDTWTKYVVPYSVMKQDSGWGSPIVHAITPNNLYSVQFQVNLPGQNYEIWIDDLGFSGCGGGGTPAPAAPAPAAPPPAEPAPAPAEPAPAEGAAPAEG
jgi:endoglucanase